MDLLKVAMATFAITTLTLTCVCGQTASGEETLEVKVLGRPITLGMLYNLRTDTLIPGRTLWNPNRLALNVTRLHNPKSSYRVKQHDTFKDKVDLLDIKGGLMGSFLAGMFSVEGSAKYLEDKRSSRSTSRVTLKYEAFTHYDSLTMVHLNRSNIQYPEVFADSEATHVVAGITYGSSAYFIFEKNVNRSSDVMEVEARLSAAVNYLPKLSVSINAAVDYQDSLRQNASGATVKFLGDMILSHQPTTLEETMEVYRNISRMMMGNSPQSVPMIAHLLPLKKLDPTGTFAIVREISEATIRDMIQIMTDLEETVEAVQDFEASQSYRRFDYFTLKVDRFSDLLQRYQLQFRRHIADLMPQIRGAGREESELATILEEHFDSPFSKANLNHWIERQDTEMELLNTYVYMLQNVSYSHMEGHFFRQTSVNDEVISLNLYFPVRPDPFLNILDDYLDDSNNNPDQITMGQSWVHQYSVRQNIKFAIEDILQYQNANAGSSIAFLYQTLRPFDLTQQWPSAEIKGYRSQGRNSNEESFIPPGPPRNIEESVEDHGVTVRWDPPQYGADFVESFEVKVTERGRRLDQEPITQTYRTTETQFLIEDPEKSVPYNVYVYGVCRIGRTASSEVLYHSGVEVRLVGGAEICSPRRAHSGRIEVLHNSVWGTVCGPWTDREAAVACKAYGHASGVAGLLSSQTEGSGQIWMANVTCEGTEESLDLCSFKWADTAECDHSMDAVADCYGGEPTGNATTPEQCTINDLGDQLELSRRNLRLAQEELINERNMRSDSLAAERRARNADITALESSLDMERTQRTNDIRAERNARINDISSLQTSLSEYFSVAFHALLLNSTSPRLFRFEKVKFNSVQLNRGNGYDKTTGIFTVPAGKGGLYHFDVFLMMGGLFARFDLEKNDNVLCDIEKYSETRDNGMGACSATAELNPGDQIYVELDLFFGSPETSVVSHHNDGYNGFTGFLLRPS